MLRIRIPFLKRSNISSFSRSLRENEAKEGRYPQGPLHRGMQKIFRRNRQKILCFGKPGRRLELFIKINAIWK